jgi:hypothetical protein
MEPEEADPDTATLREAHPWGSRVPDRSSQRYQKAGQKIFFFFCCCCCCFFFFIIVFDEDPLKAGSSGCDSAPCFHARLSQSGCSGSLSPRPPQHRCSQRTVKCLSICFYVGIQAQSCGFDLWVCIGFWFYQGRVCDFGC